MAIIYGARTDRLINALDGVTDGADTIIGDGEAETIFGLGGDDLIKGGGGADRLYGGTGIDTAFYTDSGEGVWVSLEAGRGLRGTAEGDQLYNIENVTGSEHRDELYGDDNDNTLSGEGGDDLIKGGGGSDRLLGGAGNDSIVVDGLDFVDGGAGIDTLSFEFTGLDSRGRPDLYGVDVSLSSGHFAFVLFPTRFPSWHDDPSNVVNVENVAGTEASDRIGGNDADNILLGYGGSDRLWGGQGNDIIDGGDGADRIWGSAGNDHLWGGAGDDRFHFARREDFDTDHFIFPRREGLADLGHDVVYDFEVGRDLIVVSEAISYRQVDDDVVITFVHDADHRSSITLLNVSLGSLTSSDFLLV